MSLGNTTKCDLSAGKAVIDLDALTRQTEIHFYSLMEKMEKQASNIKNNCLNPKDKREALLGMVSHGSDSMIRRAKNITEVAELLHTLYNADNRDIEVIK